MYNIRHDRSETLATRRFRVYNCYLRVNDQGMAERQEILEQILTHAIDFAGPVFITGDMNTTVPEPKQLRFVVQWLHRVPKPDLQTLGPLALRNEKFLFLETARKYGFEEGSDLNVNTWCIPGFKWELFKLKLDWMLYRGGVNKRHSFGPYIGDHRSIIGEFEL
jgi:hypothetical protein